MSQLSEIYDGWKNLKKINHVVFAAAICQRK